MGSKKKSERLHARRRARERYGIEVGAHTRRRIIQAIQAGRSKPVRRTSNRNTVHDVTLDDELVVRVVYDNQRKEIVTFLPPEKGDRHGTQDM